MRAIENFGTWLSFELKTNELLQFPSIQYLNGFLSVEITNELTIRVCMEVLLCIASMPKKQLEPIIVILDGQIREPLQKGRLSTVDLLVLTS
jgi:hypothetical protein